MTFPQILGHERVKEQLRAALREGRVPQGVLLVGPEHIGKSLLARALATALQCPVRGAQGGDDACGTCTSCRMVAHGSHPDTIVLEDDGEGISIETVRAVTDRLSLTGQSEAKVVVVEAAGRMSFSAEGALLKTLEEPTVRTHFILTASSPDDVLPTIRSRCTMLQTGLVPEEQLRPIVDAAGRSAEAETLLALSDGRPGLLTHFLQDEAAFAEEKARFTRALELLTTPELLGRFRLAGESAEDHAEAVAFLRMLLLALRQLLRSAPDTAVPATRLVLSALEDLRTNARPRLILEDLVVQLPRFDRVPMRSAS